MYTIGQVAEMFNLPISTLRYYDKEGFFPNIQRVSGIRKFSKTEIQSLQIIECLKKSGLEIKDIKLFTQWCNEGSSTYEKRHDLFLRQKQNVEAEIEQLNHTLSILKYKCWYYEQAIKDGNEDRLQDLNPEDLPEEIREAYRSLYT